MIRHDKKNRIEHHQEGESVYKFFFLRKIDHAYEIDKITV